MTMREYRFQFLSRNSLHSSNPEAFSCPSELTSFNSSVGILFIQASPRSSALATQYLFQFLSRNSLHSSLGRMVRTQALALRFNSSVGILFIQAPTGRWSRCRVRRVSIPQSEFSSFKRERWAPALFWGIMVSIPQSEFSSFKRQPLDPLLDTLIRACFVPFTATRRCLGERFSSAPGPSHGSLACLFVSAHFHAYIGSRAQSSGHA